mgnify:FL=1
MVYIHLFARPTMRKGTTHSDKAVQGTGRWVATSEGIPLCYHQYFTLMIHGIPSLPINTGYPLSFQCINNNFVIFDHCELDTFESYMSLNHIYVENYLCLFATSS